MSGLTVGSLFAGYGGLDLAVHQVTGGTTVWHSEIADAPSRILAARFPGVPNLGDIGTVDWGGVPKVDVLCGGFPCTDVSTAGARGGLIRRGHDSTRSGLWARMADAVDRLRPGLVILENVRGLTSAKADCDVEWCPWCMGDADPEYVLLALGAVLGDLADIGGYDVRWCGLRASDVGAPHGRYRIFVTATDTRRVPGDPWRLAAPGQADSGRPHSEFARRGGTRAAADTACDPWRVSDRNDGTAADTVGGGRPGRAPLTVRGTVGRVAPAGRGADAAADPASVGRDRGPGSDAQSHRRGERPRRADTDGRTGWGQDDAAPDTDCEPDQRARADQTRRAVVATVPRRTQPGSGSTGPEPVTRGGAAPADPSGARLRQHPPGTFTEETGPHSSDEPAGDRRSRAATDWGPYAPAIARWERTLGRTAPAPTEPGPTGAQRLSPRFVEFMMGLPDGWVTAVPGITRNDQLKALGNGVVPQQAAAALYWLLDDEQQSGAVS